jgi:hypothetical protein
MNPLERAALIDAAGTALQHGGESLAQFPILLERILDEEAWRSFTTQRGETVTHETLDEFVGDPPLAGLGSNVAQIDRLLAEYPRVKDKFDAGLERKGGRPAKTTGIAGGLQPEHGTQREALRRLRSQAPALHARVLAGELSPNAAMIEAGFRHPTINVPLDDMSRLAGTLRRRLDSTQLAELRTLLTEMADA